jgi:hypothetical protein
MAALTEVYVDPAIAGNSGTGTIGDPYGDLQYALNTMTRDATNGNRINVKAGTAEILAATISLATYGTPDATAPLKFQGYTSTAGDGGLGVIDGNAGNFVILNANAYVHFEHLRLTNTGSAAVVKIGYYGSIRFCEADTSTSDGIYSNDGLSVCERCYVHNVGGYGIRNFRNVQGCYLANGANVFSYALLMAYGSASGNMISLSGASSGVVFSITNEGIASNNSILSSAGTGTGIALGAVYSKQATDNLIEGFSGIGGVGVSSTTTDRYTVNRNAAYNCTTAYSLGQDLISGDEDNETLSASPFAKTGSLPTDFSSPTFWAEVLAYFAPADTGNVLTGGINGGAKGAVPAAATAGGGVIQPGMSGGFNG